MSSASEALTRDSVSGAATDVFEEADAPRTGELGTGSSVRVSRAVASTNAGVDATADKGSAARGGKRSATLLVVVCTLPLRRAARATGGLSLGVTVFVSAADRTGASHVVCCASCFGDSSAITTGGLFISALSESDVEKVDSLGAAGVNAVSVDACVATVAFELAFAVEFGPVARLTADVVAGEGVETTSRAGVDEVLVVVFSGAITPDNDPLKVALAAIICGRAS